MNVGMDWPSLVASNRSKRCKGPILQNSSSSLSLLLRGLPSFLSLSPSRSGPWNLGVGTAESFRSGAWSEAELLLVQKILLTKFLIFFQKYVRVEGTQDCHDRNIARVRSLDSGPEIIAGSTPIHGVKWRHKIYDHDTTTIL